jgi:ubiquinone/menaquinone biosynthesis C-methylase UbiE
MADPDHVASTRSVYDQTAAQYAMLVGTTVSAEIETPIDRAVLDAFAEEAIGRGGQTVDIGCGVGRVTAYLADRGVDICGVDISSGMISQARSAHPGLRFDVGSSSELPFEGQSLTGAVLWYSIIHTPLAELPAVWRELARVLIAPGHVLIAFQEGRNDEVIRPEAHGSTSTLTNYRHSLDDVATSLGVGGFRVRARWWREAESAHETTPHAGLLARLEPDSAATVG